MTRRRERRGGCCLTRILFAVLATWIVLQVTWITVGPTVKARFCALPLTPCEVIP